MLRTLSIWFPTLLLGLLLSVAACDDGSSTDDTTGGDTTGGDTTGDEPTDTTGGDGDTTAGDGDTTGGDGDTTAGDGDGDDNVPPAASAENLGVPCPMGTCPNGEACITVTVDDDMDPSTDPVPLTGGFCTVPCEGQMDTTSCSNEFPGPGVPVCALSSGTGFSCAVFCDSQQAPDCPEGTMCISLGAGITQGICGPRPG